MDPSIKNPRVNLTLKSWGFYLDMPHDSLVRVIIVVMAVIAVILTVPSMNWSSMVVIGTLAIIRIIKVIVTLVLVMVTVPMRNWSLRISMVVIRMLTLTRLSYLQSFYRLHPPRKVVHLIGHVAHFRSHKL